MTTILRSWVKVCLFLVSYFPLFVIMIILHYDNSIILYASITTLSVGFVGLFITFYVLNRISGEYKQATSINPESKINFQYFLAYIIPFVAIDMDSMRQIVAYAVLFIFLGILYIRTELIYVNPTLTMLGYHLLKIKINDEDILLITKNSFEKALKNPVVLIGRGLYLERRSS